MAIGEGELGRGISPAPLGDRGRHGVLRPVLGRIADLLLPLVCISCRARIFSHGLLCGDCFAKLDFIAPPLCARPRHPAPLRCGRACALGRGNRLPASLRPRPRCRALFGHDARPYPELQVSAPAGGLDAVRQMAATRRRGAADRRRSDHAGAAIPVAALVAALQSVGHVGVRPRPVDRTSRRLLRVEAGSAHLEPSWALRRSAPPQCGRRAFSVDPARAHSLKGRKVVLVDDVITTGATAEACSRVLRRAKAARVDVLALARAVEPTAFVL